MFNDYRYKGRAAIAALLVLALSCTATPADPPKRRVIAPVENNALLDDLEHRTFNFFWQTANPQNGLVPDRWPSPSFSSIAAVGFGLTAYGIGVERGYVARDAAAQRVLTTLQFFLSASQNTEVANATSYKGFYYHFLDMQTGARFKDVELSTIDTTLLLAGALFCESYFDRDNPTERAIRDAAEELYRRADWTYFLARPPLISMGWTPEKGLHDFDWHGYNEAMILVVLALGSPTHAVDPAAWKAYTSTFEWHDFYGQQYVTFPPLFGYQYSHIWIDFRGIQDDYMRGKAIDYFENSKRAAYAQQAYAMANPGRWKGYGETIWGLTACDGPVDAELTINGTTHKFKTYSARGPSPQYTIDDGTLAPTAAASSVAFAPDIAFPAIEEMRRRYGDRLYQQYGFLDSFNPTLDFETHVQAGHIVPGIGWFDVDYLGIDQGPIVAMVENYRSGLVWRVMRGNPHIIAGLKRAGFTGGWLK
ncbi:MAG TPA: glucoamylase family protein [Thermoanaerobaculia bacterium]